ncbi:transcriptional repressor TraM [Rhizobium rhizogenes]|uniref:transcriptional repressor TraM n=1 Tax=Rhizobium rhizogenes TaxID=359 RepID=UPI0022B68D35|nr:transcriptional repressor TraM [Rhizobium rhizogenes]MCZ7448171.1 transcriptional repressor TraM [Rhizobium rhizogenes]MCZ7465832.1 transcriptional repressor TraM [Rhizobium rhizogenes]
MSDAESSETERRERDHRFCSMPKEALEELAVSAIYEHRRLLAADEAVYEEWTRASCDPSVSSDVLASLQDEYVERQKKSGAQQEELSQIIDALGYIPDVPLDDAS